MHDRYLQSLKRLEEARVDLEVALERFGHATRAVTHALEDGGGVASTLQELHWVEIRRSTEEGWLAFQHALYEARCYAVGIMVDEEGLSISEIARIRGLSRQLVSRLYNDCRTRAGS